MSGLRCQKVRHPTKAAACMAWKHTGRNVQMNIYQCRNCKGWHLGTSGNPLRKMARIGQIFDNLKAAPNPPPPQAFSKSGNDMTTWYIARLKAGATNPAKRRLDLPAERQAEALVERALVDEGFLAYLPRMKKDIRHHRTKKMFTRSFPLFVGYIFVAAPEGEPNFSRLRACDGIAGFLGLDGRPWPIPTETVDALQDAQARLIFDETREATIMRAKEARTQRDSTALEFPKGARIQATEGPFAGFHGHVINVTGRGMIKAAIEIFAQLTPVEFHASGLRRERP